MGDNYEGRRREKCQKGNAYAQGMELRQKLRTTCNRPGEHGERKNGTKGNGLNGRATGSIQTESAMKTKCGKEEAIQMINHAS